MNQEQNNLNTNNFNIQGNNGIPNNQTLNNQSFNQGMSINQQPVNPQPQPAPSYEQPMNQVNIGQPTSQPMNTFESDNINNQNFNSKPPKKMNLGLITGIVVAAVVVGVGIFFGSKLLSNDSTFNNGKNVSISYINTNKSDSNKLAILLKSGSNIEYVLTIDNEKKIELSNDYLDDLYNDHLKFKIKDDYKFELTLNDIYIDINDEDIDENDIIINQKNNWYLVQWADEYTRICLKIDDPNYSWNENWISFDITDKNSQDLNVQYFEKIVKNFNVYIVNNNSSNLSFTDFEGNNVNLSNYTFINDSIVSSLIKYDIYLKKSIGIEKINSNIIYDTDNQLYFIELIDIDEYNEDVKKYDKQNDFSYNNLNYEIYYSDNESYTDKTYIIFYRKINNKYLRISEFIDNNQDINNIKDNLIKDIL